MASVFGLALLAALIPQDWPVGVASAAPNQVWRVTFAGNQGGAAATPCSHNLDVDWRTGDVFVSYTALDPTASTDAAQWRRLRQTTGAVVTGGSVGSGVNLGGCSVALDQRGRVYFLISPNSEESQVYSTAGELLTTFDPNVLGGGGIGTNVGIFADAWSDLTTVNTRFVLRGTSEFVSWLMTDEDTHVATPTCEGSRPTQANGPMDYREDETFSNRIWTPQGDLSNHALVLVNSETCAGVASYDEVENQRDSGADFFSVRLYWLKQSTYGDGNLEINRLDVSDETTPIGALQTVLNLDVGGQNAVNAVKGADVATDGTVLTCGQNFDSSAAWWFAEVNSAITTINWIQAMSSTESVTTCKLGLDGAIYVAGMDTAPSPDVFFVEKWCCTTGSVEMDLPDDVESIPQLEVPVVTPPVVPESLDFGPALRAFAVSIGFESEGSLFFFGLILVMIVALVAGGATKGVTDSDPAATVMAGVGAAGMMPFLTFEAIWPLWTTVVLIIITSAIVVLVVKYVFVGGGE